MFKTHTMKIGVAAAIAAASIGIASATLAAELKGPADFSSIKNDKERSLALFGEAGKVLTHPRCVNCHPAGNRPLQGDEQRLHQPLVVRGDGGMGATGMRCTTCHGQAISSGARCQAGLPGTLAGS